MRLFFATGSRADWGKMRPLIVASALRGHDVIVGLVGAASHEEQVRTDLAPVRCRILPFGAPMAAMEGVYGSVVAQFSDAVVGLALDAVVVHGDRIEALAIATVAAVAGVRLIHVEAGEVSGSLDEPVRQAISRLSTAFCVCSQAAEFSLLESGEQPERIFVTGSPERDGIPPTVPTDGDLSGILIAHPLPLDVSETKALARCIAFLIPHLTIVKWLVFAPNDDRHSSVLWEAIARLGIDVEPDLPPERFESVARGAAVIVGNSSAGVREAAWWGVPAVNIGTRQSGRLPENSAVVTVAADPEAVLCAVQWAIEDGPQYEEWERLFFGDGHAAERFLDSLDRIALLPIQKKYA